LQFLFVIDKENILFYNHFDVMISRNRLDFLEQLGANNSKERMDEHRDWYQDVRKEYLWFAQKLIDIYGWVESWFIDKKPSDVIFRINRDIRFSKNKSPYKSWMSVYLAPSGKNRELIWPYIHIQPGNQSFIGCGLWTPQSRVLRAFREYVAVHYTKFTALLSDKDLVNFFGVLQTQWLKTYPKWFTKDHPALQYLQYKSFTFQRSFSDAEVLDPKFLDICTEAMKIQLDFNRFVNTAIEEGRPIGDGEIFG